MKNNWYDEDDENEYNDENLDSGQLRLCINCGCEYYDLAHSRSQYWDPPYSYYSGASTHCLTCWLDCGPAVPIFESQASVGCCFSAVIDAVAYTEDYRRAITLHAPHYAAVEAAAASWGYQLLDQGAVLKIWPRSNQDDILDDARFSNQIGRAVILMPAFMDTEIQPGQRLEFVTKMPPNRSNLPSSSGDDEIPF
jgi:hypothetical protein